MISVNCSDLCSFSAGGPSETPLPEGQQSIGPPPILPRSQRDAKTVLIADSDRDLLNILSVRCRRLGLKVLAAPDATTALAIIRLRSLQLICLDLQMSADDGSSLCERISGVASPDEVPLIILTGQADPDTIMRCNAMGAYYVEKGPQIWNRLEPLLKELLDDSPAPPADAAGYASMTLAGDALCESHFLVATSESLCVPELQPCSPVPAPSADFLTETTIRPANLDPTAIDQEGAARSAEPPVSRSETEHHEVPETSEIESNSSVATESVWSHITQTVERLLTRAVGTDEDDSLAAQASTPIAANVTDDHIAASEHCESALAADEIAILESADASDCDEARYRENLEHTPVSIGHQAPCQLTPNDAARLIDLDKAWTTIGKDKPKPQTPIERKKDGSLSQAAKGETQKTILIADDDGDLVQMLALRFNEMGLHVFRSPDAMHALLGVNRVRPDLALLDVNMPGGNGLSVCEMLAGDDVLSKIPVIIMSGESGKEIQQRCRTLHATYVPKGAGLWDRLEPVVRRALGMVVSESSEVLTGPSAETEPIRRRPSILCIDDDPDISKILKLRLDRYGVDVLRAFNGMQGYWTALDMRPDMIILDMVMPDGSGNYIFGRLRSHPLTEKVPVLMLTGINTPGIRRQMFGLGVDAFLTKPIDFIALLEHIRQYVPICDAQAATMPCEAADSHEDVRAELLVAN
jgi:DNA-binding response OmpR family regulator